MMLELLVLLSVLALLTLGIQQISDWQRYQQCKQMQKQVLAALQRTQLVAQLNQAPSYCTLKTDTLLCQTQGITLNVVSIPNWMHANQTRRMGFSTLGRTASAGSLRFTYKRWHTRISLGVGLGVISIQ